MSVILPWDRKKAAEQPSPRSRAGRERIRRITGAGIAGAVAIATLALIVGRFHIPPEEVVWEVPGGRLLSSSEGLYLIDVGGKTRLMDPQGSSTPVELPVRPGERIVCVLGGGAVLAQKQARNGQYGEPWYLSLYTPSGSPMWTTSLPGAIAQACAAGDRLAAGICDLSAGAAPSVALLDLRDGHLIWLRALRHGAWRALALLTDGTAVAVLTSGVEAFAIDGSPSWDFDVPGDILAATAVGDTTCLCTRVNRGLFPLVYRYQLTALSPDGSLMWSVRLAQEPAKLQQWMGEEAVVAIAENHVLGLEMRDGARLFAERTRANPVELCGDKLLIRDDRGVRLVRLRSVRLPSG